MSCQFQKIHIFQHKIKSTKKFTWWCVRRVSLSQDNKQLCIRRENFGRRLSGVSQETKIFTLKFFKIFILNSSLTLYAIKKFIFFSRKFPKWCFCLLMLLSLNNWEMVRNEFVDWEGWAHYKLGEGVSRRVRGGDPLFSKKNNILKQKVTIVTQRKVLSWKKILQRV